MKLSYSLPIDYRVSYKARHEIHELDQEERNYLKHQLIDHLYENEGLAEGQPEEMVELISDEKLLTLAREKGVIL